MRALLLVAIAWSACDALLLGPAYATQRAPAYRAHVRLEEGGAPAPTAAPSTFTADEIAALKEARWHAACVFSGLWLTYSALSCECSVRLCSRCAASARTRQPRTRLHRRLFSTPSHSRRSTSACSATRTKTRPRRCEQHGNAYADVSSASTTQASCRMPAQHTPR